MSNLTFKLNTVLESLPNEIEKGGVMVATSTLEQKANDIRNLRVNWPFYRTGDFISQADFDFIVKYDSLQTPEERKSFIDENPMLCVESFLNILLHISKDQVSQFILVLIDDLFTEDKSRVETFKEFCKKNKQSIWDHFDHQLNRTDGFIVNMSLRIIAKIACFSTSLMEGRDLHIYIHRLKDQLNIPNNEYVQSVARCLQMMLRIEDYKTAFVCADGISIIISVLSGRVNFQTQYQLVFCLWLMAFSPSYAEKMSRNNVVPVLASILNESSKEKVIRIILATFKNLIQKPNDRDIARDNAITMFQCKVLKQLNILKQGQKLDDEDLIEDVEFVYEKLQESVHDLSSFDEYSSEIKSGRIGWSPVHSNEKFWRENAQRLNEKNYELLKILISILETSKDPQVLAVAAHDIGEYVRYYPRGKIITENLGGKQLIMQLLNDEDPNVKYEALVCVQKMMVHNWEYLGKQLANDTGKENKPVNAKA